MSGLISDEMRAWVGDAGRRAADRAPRIEPGTDVAIELQRIFYDWPELMRQADAEIAQEQAEQQPGEAA